ncbi:hypothetical protein IFT67_05915 [Sphingomonas sp. CFBP 13728]|uniref:hypothetical protein n=1 Tax=Sphingomonas sp. CFBP 13728 TaxID=2775294 RepID=UPI00177B5BD7|nr:hypothetical protein [Sphingomonas sp. CFBP 13728]MBD8618452.1 hypothetical protein [Sphingomonas sp. CFBP 13728]
MIAIARPLEMARSETVASPWREPLFYLSFVAGVLLLIAIGVILGWRLLHRSWDLITTRTT